MSAMSFINRSNDMESLAPFVIGKGILFRAKIRMLFLFIVFIISIVDKTARRRTYYRYTMKTYKKGNKHGVYIKIQRNISHNRH